MVGSVEFSDRHPDQLKASGRNVEDWIGLAIVPMPAWLVCCRGRGHDDRMASRSLQGLTRKLGGSTTGRQAYLVVR